MRKSKSSVFFFVLFSSLFLAFSSVYAQEFKFMGGAAFSKYSNPPQMGFIVMNEYFVYLPSSLVHKSGLVAGLGVELNLTEKLAFEVDGMFCQKGSHYYYSDGPYDMEQEFSLNVLSFPALLRFKPFPKTSPYILGGGEFSVVLSHKVTYFTDGLEGPMEDKGDKVKSYDFGLVLGGGLEIPLKNLSFFIEARYHPGLTDISKDRTYFPSLEISAVSVMVGFKI